MPRAVARRGPLLLTILIAGGLVAAFLVFSEIFSEWLWYESVQYQTVFTTEWVARLVLFAVAFLLVGGVVALSLWLAFRLRPVGRPASRSQLLDRYRELLSNNLAMAVLAPAGFLGLMAGISAAAQSTMALAWLNRTPFGQVDPYFGMDASFYVFELPVWQQLLGFLMSALFFSLVAALAVHFITGGIGVGASRTPAAARGPRIQLSVLAALLLIGYAIQLLLDRYVYLVSTGSLYTGVQFTDANARFGAKLVMAVIALICAGLFVANAFMERWVLPITGLVLMLVSSLVLQWAYPGVIQAFQVSPNEPDKERNYIQAHIDATRAAYAIEDVEIESYAAITEVQAGQLRQDAEALPGIRLIDPSVISPNFQQRQQVRGFYSVASELDVDRYVIDGTETDAVVAARELNVDGLADKNWNNLHTVYTHGSGLIAAYGNQRQSSGDPVWIEQSIPSVGKLGDYEGRIYFGEMSTTFAIVGREEGQEPIEFDIPSGGAAGGTDQYNVYDGTGGVAIGDPLRRLVYATHLMDVNLLLSDRVNSQSKLLYQRTPKERVAKVAPWLTLDQNIYPAVVDGRLVWIVDGYTTSDSYPNSQAVSLRSTTADAQGRLSFDQQVNYLRNSVKAVVDATDGSVALYAWEEDDPILKAYSAAFPGTVKARSEMSPDLLAHVRYPEDLFKVQREILGRYHMTDPNTWYQNSDLWQVPVDPVKQDSQAAEPPYYLSIKWPGDEAPVFSQTSVFVPNNRSNLAAYLSVIAEATSPDYGKLRVLRMPDNNQIDGPGQTFNAMTTNQEVADELRNFLNQGSAAASYGNLLTLPMGSGLLYVLPVYTQRSGSTGSYPALTYVVVRFGQSVGIGKTLQEALDKTFAGDAGVSTGEQEAEPSTDPSPSPTGSATPSATPTPGSSAEPTSTVAPTADAATQELLQQAQDAFVAADAALKAGDLATYQQQIEAAQKALDEAMTRLGR